MLDLFSYNVPLEIILQVLEIARNNPESMFLIETKNPKRYCEIMGRNIPKNIVLGVTIESNRDYSSVSFAPTQISRLHWMLFKTENPIFISIEPILDFDLELFVQWIKRIRPWAVAVGYDNYNNKLPEPELYKTEKLIEELEKAGIKVYRKTIRKAWWEK